MRVQIRSRNRGRKICRVRQRRHFVAEISARNNCARGDGRIELQRACNCHERHANRADGGPRAADAERNQSADNQTRKIKPRRIEKFYAEPRQRCRCARHAPRANQRADREQNKNRAHRGRDSIYRVLAQIFEVVAVLPCNGGSKQRAAN